MKYQVTFDIDNFEFWGMAKKIYNAFKEANKLPTLQKAIEGYFNDDYIPTAAEINDTVAFGIAQDSNFLRANNIAL